MEPYCECKACTSNWFDPRRFFICRCCCGCIKAGKDFARNIYVKKAKEKSMEKIKAL